MAALRHSEFDISHFRNGSSGGFRTHIDLFTRQAPFCVGHGGMKSGASRWLARRSESAIEPIAPPLEMVRHAGSAPALSVWKTGMLLLHQ